jgi:hypothetical protein
MHKILAWIIPALILYICTSINLTDVQASSPSTGPTFFPTQTRGVRTARKFAPAIYGEEENLHFESNDCEFELYKRAITKKESGGSYWIRSGKSTNGHFAWGKYQVMGFNIKPWTSRFIGRPMSIEDFRNSPEAQEAVFRGLSKERFRQYGSWDHVASLWFSGQPYSAAMALKDDAFGTTVGGYVGFVRAYMRKHASECTQIGGAKPTVVPDSPLLPDSEVTVEIGRAAQAALNLHCRKYNCPKGGINAEGTRYPYRTKSGQKLFMTAKIHSNCADGSNRCPHTGISVYTK